jgi:hypothetical protein
MKKFLISEEERSRILSLHEGFKKELLKEDEFRYGSEYFTKVEGPFQTQTFQGSVYIMKLEKTLCRYDDATKRKVYGDEYDSIAAGGEYILMTGSTCNSVHPGFTTIPGGKFYVLYQGGDDGSLIMYPRGSQNYTLATNGSKGYNTKEEAKKAISLIMNPQGKVGRDVIRGTSDDGGKYKIVNKYNQQGDLKKVKSTWTTDSGDKNRNKRKTGL